MTRACSRLPRRESTVYVVDTTGGQEALALAAELRAAGIATDRSFDQRSMKSQMKAADRSGAAVAVIVGRDELAAGAVDAARPADRRGPRRTATGGGAPNWPRRRHPHVVAGMSTMTVPRACAPTCAATLRASTSADGAASAAGSARRREHGEHLAFVDLRDHTGLVQCVVDDAVDVRSEYVVRITGIVRAPARGHDQRQPRRPARSRSATARSRSCRRPSRRRSRSTRAPTTSTRPSACTTATSTCAASGCSATCASAPRSTRPSGRPWSARASSRSRRRCWCRRPRRAPASSSCRRARSPARSTRCRSRRSCSSSC